MATDAEAVAQHVRQRLMTHEGEWFLDTAAGVPWLGRVMGQSYNPTIMEALVKSEVLATDGVTEIIDFSVSFDKSSRGVVIRRLDVLSEYDGVSV